MNKIQILELIDEFERKVMNGGFDQYLFNSADDRATATFLAQERIGAAQAASILKKGDGQILGRNRSSRA